MKIASKIYNHLVKDSLYRNSIYLMLSTTVLAGFGFFFWIIAAREFSTNEVGVATALISAVTLIGSFSLLGLNISLNRFLPKSGEKNKLISTAGIFVILASIIAAIIFLFGINLFSSKLSFLLSAPVYLISFFIFITIYSLNILLDSTFMAYRASVNILLKSIVLGVLKITFLLSLVSFGAYGIFSSYSAAMAASFLVGFCILFFRFGFRPKLKVDFNIVRKFAKYSGGNYVAGFISTTPTLVLPIIILNSLGATASAYFYIDNMIFNLLITVPLSTSQSLLSEGSHEESLLKQHFIKSLKITYLILVPSVLVIFLFGNYVLKFFGKSYEADAFTFLQIISISVLFTPISYFGNSLLLVRNKINILIAVNLLNAALILSFSFLLLSGGLVGIGIALLISQVIMFVVFTLVVIRLLKQK